MTTKQATQEGGFPSYLEASAPIDKDTFKKLQQRGYDKTGNNPSAFLALPEVVAEKIGLFTHMGARIECAVLARLLFEEKVRDTSERVVKFQGFGEYTKPKGTFILSIERIARDLWQRWFHQDGDGDTFDRFYDRMRKAVGRLEDDGWLRRVEHPHGNRCFGYVWSFEGTFLAGAAEELPQCRYTGARLLHSGAAPDEEVYGAGEGLTNVVDVIGEAFVADNPTVFTEGEVVTSLSKYGRGNYGNIFGWSRQVASTGANGVRFTTIGAWRQGEEGLANKAQAVPWITFDIDREDLWEAWEVARRIVDRLGNLGAPLEKVHVSFSGKKGFHIRIPSGMAGAPVFANSAEAERILRRFCEAVADEDVDLSTCDPRQNIRLIGSVRANGYHVTAWDAKEFSAENMTLQHVLNESKTHSLYDIGHVQPMSIAAVPSLVEAMVGAMDTTRKATIPSFGEAKKASGKPKQSGVMNRAMEGCAEGVVWWDKGDKLHRGRSKLLFMAGCQLLREHGERKAWRKLKDVNEKCEPPMRERELEGRFKSARRTVSREVRR